MNITNAQYSEGNESIIATIDGKQYAVPCVVGNREYDEIMRQVESGDLTIADAD
jgi:hypothetical protein